MINETHLPKLMREAESVLLIKEDELVNVYIVCGGIFLLGIFLLIESMLGDEVNKLR